MPPLPRIRTGALADLADQLRYVPRETLRRQIVRAEELVGEINPAGAYPEDWVVFKVTGYRSEVHDPAVLAGEALMADLSAFVERLSALAPPRWADLEPGRFIDAGALAARWKVSRKTLDRLRRRGLIAHRVQGENGKPRLAFPVASVERFEARHAPALARAGAFTRIPANVEDRIVRRAAAYRRRLGCTLNQAAGRLARRFGRSHEAVRQILRRAEARADAPTFSEPTIPSLSERRLIDRAARRGIEPSDIAQRLRRSTASIRRVITDARAERLREWAAHARLSQAQAPLQEALEHAAVRTGLGAPGQGDLLAMIEDGRARSAPRAEVERVQAAAYHALLGRAAAVVRALPEHGSAASRVDEAETYLRWAARLKVELVRQQLPTILRSVEAVAGRGLEEIRSAALASLAAAAIDAGAEALDSFDPSRTGRAGRLAAPVGLAVTRAATRFVKEHARDFGAPVGARATPRLRTGVLIDDWTRRVAPWQAFLEPSARVRAALPTLDELSRRLLVARFGWDGPPMTIAQLAATLRTTVMRAAILERRAVRAALKPPTP